MNWLTKWRNRRRVRRFERIHDRDLAAMMLERNGRYAEAAEELAEIEAAYLRETWVADHLPAAILARIRRCAALIRAGQRAQGRAEAEQLAAMLYEFEGPDGEYLRRLRDQVAAAERGEE